MKNLDGNVDIFNPPLKQPDTEKQAPGPDREEQVKQQLRRIDECRTAALTNPSYFEAAIGAETSNMLEILARLAEAILTGCDDAALTLETLPAYGPSMDSYLRVAKQAAQYSQLQIQLARIDKPARQNRPR